MSTDVQTPCLGTPLAPLKCGSADLIIILCIYIYICIYVYIYMYVYIHIYICMYIYIYIYIYIYNNNNYNSNHMYIYIYTCIGIHAACISHSYYAACIALVHATCIYVISCNRNLSRVLAKHSITMTADTTSCTDACHELLLAAIV